MTSPIFNDNGGDTAEEKAFREIDLPLPLPFPPDDVDETESDHSDWENDNNSRGKQSLLRSIVDNKRKDVIGDDEGGSDYNSKSSVNETRQLDCLPPDVFVLICCSLTVQDITSLAVCSKALYVASLNQDLWRQKFQARWNYDDPTIVDWASAYRQAYFNPNDLWITHWNCVEPCDGLGPGRCCIQEKELCGQKYNKKETTEFTLKTADGNDKDGRSYTTNKGRNKHLCPSCRYHPCIQNGNETQCSSCDAGTVEEESRTQHAADSTASSRTPISTVAQAIHVATSLRLEESSHLLPSRPYSPKLAQLAFTKSSTFHRSIDHWQYKADSLCFLKDLLFFNVHDNHDENNLDDELFEMRDWKKYAKKITERQNNEGRTRDQYSLGDCDAFEPALHSWHLANICNPDYNRPIVWKILIQRSDCFTVFPSEGYLLPGESKVVTFGVKPFGSLLAHATHKLNIHRDGVDDFWRNLYGREAHLPFTPFLFQYHYASNVPCQFVDSTCQPGNQQQHQNSPWKQSSLNQNQYVRSFFLEGHVHANYSLSEFRRKTLVPYALPSHQISRTEKFIRRYLPREQHLTYSMSPVVFCSPQLMEFYPAEWQRLQALRLEEQRNNSSLALKYRTESACHECGLTWGPRMEEFGQAFVLAKLEIELVHRSRRERIQSLHRILVCLVQQYQNYRSGNISIKTKSWMVRNQNIINHLRKIVMNYRGAPWLNHDESRVFLQWEILLDFLSQTTLIDRGNMNSLGHGGVYRYPTSTDSVFNRNSSFDRKTADLLIDDSMIIWKDEPKDLMTFSHLVYGPGKFCFPNEDRKKWQARSNQQEMITDTFMNNQICSLKAGISVLADPRSLLIHGLFDEVPYPGGIFRRPKLPILLKLNEGRCLDKVRKKFRASFDPFITSRAQLAYYELQESLDIQGLLIVNSFYTQCCDTQAVPHSISLRNFIQNVPAPGNGRFAFNTAKCNVHQNQDRLGLNEFWFLEEKLHTDVTEMIFEEKVHGLVGSNSNTLEVKQHRLSQQNVTPGGALGPREVAGANIHALARGPRILNILWSFSSQLGWTVDENQRTELVYVDRRILIAAQCLSLTLMLIPLSATLFARYFRLIPAQPTSYLLEGLPYEIETKMRFLTQTECGYVGIMLVLLHCVLCRWIERYTNRDFLRAMMEHIMVRQEYRLFHKLKLRILEWGERIWDALCPSTLQRLLFLPRWNCRNHTDLMKYVSYWRCREHTERRSTSRAIAGTSGISIEERDKSVNLGDNGSIKKILAGAITVLGGFSASSPHFFLNLLAIASCSMSLGVSVSIQSMESGRSTFTLHSGSVIESLSLVSSVIFGLLIGQLVGGSGGVLFLVEFVVTCISLVLGGMGTISASGIKSWVTFFCLSLVAFWGYLFGRCSVIENIKRKKRGVSSVILCTSFVLVLSLLFLSLTCWDWETVVDLLVQRPLIDYRIGRKFAIRDYRPNQLP